MFPREEAGDWAFIGVDEDGWGWMGVDGMDGGEEGIRGLIRSSPRWSVRRCPAPPGAEF